MFYKVKSIMIYKLILSSILGITIIFFLNIFNQSTKNLNLLSNNAVQLEITSLNENNLKIEKIEGDIKRINSSFILYKEINDGTAVYTNNNKFIENLPLYRYNEKFFQTSKQIVLSESFKDRVIENNLSIENCTFNVLSFYNNKAQLSNFFINLFDNDFKQKSSIQGTYYIDTLSKEKNQVINEIKQILNQYTSDISYNIINLPQNKYKIFTNILMNERFFLLIFFLLVVFIFINLSNSIFTWINYNKREIFCRKVFGATNMNINLNLNFTYLKLSLINMIFILGISIISINLFNLENVLIYYKFLILTLIPLFFIQLIIIMVYFNLLIKNTTLISMIREVYDSEAI